MKKSLLFVAALGMAVAANAQTESAFMDPDALLGEDASSTAVAVAAGTVLCESSSVKMMAAWDDTYKIIAMAGADDAQNSLVIDGVTYACTKGIQGQSNPKENSLMYGGQPNGAVFKFEVAQDGVLYVFGKLTCNKNYYAWEGDVANGAAAAVAYTLKAFQVNDGKEVGYTLPGDEYGWYTIPADGVAGPYDDGIKYLAADQCTEIYAGLCTSADVPASKSCSVWNNSGNALGVIALPVYAEAKEYYVNACGSKVTCDGFVFIPGATTIAEVKAGAKEASINAVSAEKAAEQVYNLYGQKAAKAGLCIVNGQKVMF